MGLDMYLRGEKFFWTHHAEPQKQKLEDGLKVTTLQVELGYWRKHPNLHGFIVDTFAEKDDCQPIDLNEDALNKIIDAIEQKKMPETQGFFFGASDGSEDAESIRILQDAIKWMHAESPKESRSVIYRASW